MQCDNNDFLLSFFHISYERKTEEESKMKTLILEKMKEESK